MLARRLAVAACSVGLIAGCSAPAAMEPAPSSQEKPRQHPTIDKPVDPVELTTKNNRGSNSVVAAGAADAPYNYGPSVMAEDGAYRMWWCSQLGIANPPGDDILYGRSSSLDGPFGEGGHNEPKPVFSGSFKGFDGMHTCDPSVIKANGTYYMYYTGAKGDHDSGNTIGLATSEDGVVWQRANDGKPVVTAAADKKRKNAYGAGQPAAVYAGGWFYLMFTDTTGAAAGWNGAGQFLLRSRDPAFGKDVQALDHHGFSAVDGTSRPRRSSLADAFSADLMWVGALDAFAVAHQTKAGTTLTFWDAGFRTNPYPRISVPGPWREGPGLVRTPKGHARIDVDDPCGTVPVDVIRATANKDAPTALRHFGLDVEGAHGCATGSRAKRVLDGFAVPSEQGGAVVIRGGTVIAVRSTAVAGALADHQLPRRPPRVASLPADVRLERGARILYSLRYGSGVVMSDGRLWRLRSESAVNALTRENASAEWTVSDRAWSRHPAGPALG